VAHFFSRPPWPLLFIFKQILHDLYEPIVVVATLLIVAIIVAVCAYAKFYVARRGWRALLSLALSVWACVALPGWLLFGKLFVLFTMNFSCLLACIIAVSRAFLVLPAMAPVLLRQIRVRRRVSKRRLTSLVGFGFGLYLLSFVLISGASSSDFPRARQSEGALCDAGEGGIIGKLALPVAQKSLVTLTVGNAHLENAERIVERFGTESFDFMLFHWDIPQHSWESSSVLKAATSLGALSHRHQYRWKKLDFARSFLTPRAVAGYSHVLLWDGDVQLSAGFDALRLLRVATEAGSLVFEPIRTGGSEGSYEQNNDGGGWTDGQCVRAVEFVEVGFQIWETMAWAVVGWEVLRQYPFKLWCFDLLPYACLLREAVESGKLSARPGKNSGGWRWDTVLSIVRSDSIVHPPNGHTNAVNYTQIHQEDTWFNEVRATMGRCTSEHQPSGAGRPSCMGPGHHVLETIQRLGLGSPT
jgi:hypothetical protein